MERKVNLHLAFYSLFLFPSLLGYTQVFNLEEDIPLDSSVKFGQLETGLSYYIKKNNFPENKIEFRLVVKAGSILEDNDQLGVAHFVEHMCFNGTKNFKKNGLINYLQSIGSEFGSDLNASTSFDETIFKLSVPSSDESKIEKALQILEDWAHQVSFEEGEIDKERGILLEEYRLRKGVENSMIGKKYVHKLFYQSRYADHLPGGKELIIEKCSYETIKRFYYDWYRPDLMAIIAVGAIDTEKMEEKIKIQFSKIKLKANSRKREYYDIPDHKNTLIAVETGSANSTQIRIYYKTEEPQPIKIKDYRKQLLYMLFNNMMNSRLNELKNSNMPPFLRAESYYTGYGGFYGLNESAYISKATVEVNGIAQGIKSLIEENERVKRFGFTESEFKRSKAKLIKLKGTEYKNESKIESEKFVRNLVNNFTNMKPVPGIEWENEFYKQVLPEIELREVNELINRWLRNENRVIIITGPFEAGLKVPPEPDILDWLNNASKLYIKPYQDNFLDTELMDKFPEPGKILSSTVDVKLRTETLILSNGARVVLKKTDYKNDEVVMSAYSLGGTSLYSEDEFNATWLANDFIFKNGVNGFSENMLAKFLANKDVAVKPYIEDLSEGLTGSVYGDDIEIMFQLIHLYFTSPGTDSSAFFPYLEKKRIECQKEKIIDKLNNELSKMIMPDDKRIRKQLCDYKQSNTNFNLVRDMYKKRFSNAGDFNFYFVGAFDEDKVRDLIETYIASLPGKESKNEQFRDLGIRPIKGPLEREIYIKNLKTSIVKIVFKGETKFDYAQGINLNLLGKLLTIKLIESLREEKSALYGVKADGYINKFPYEQYEFTITFPCAPDSAEYLKKLTFGELKKITENGPEQRDLDKVKEAQLKEFRENFKTNDYWLNYLESTDYYGYDPYRIFSVQQMLDEITVKSIKKTAKKLLKKEHCFVGVLFPKFMKNE